MCSSDLPGRSRLSPQKAVTFQQTQPFDLNVFYQYAAVLSTGAREYSAKSTECTISETFFWGYRWRRRELQLKLMRVRRDAAQKELPARVQALGVLIDQRSIRPCLENRSCAKDEKGVR